MAAEQFAQPSDQAAEAPQGVTVGPVRMISKPARLTESQSAGSPKTRHLDLYHMCLFLASIDP
jgi:hypothetical protein